MHTRDRGEQRSAASPPRLLARSPIGVLACACSALLAALSQASIAPLRAAKASPALVNVTVETLPQEVRVHLRADAVLPTHAVASVPGSDDVALRLPGRLACPRALPVNSGGIRQVVARSRGGEVLVRVRRAGRLGYRCCRVRDGRELVLVVDKGVAEAPGIGRHAHARQAPVARPAAAKATAGVAFRTRVSRPAPVIVMAPNRPLVLPGRRSARFPALRPHAVVAARVAGMRQVMAAAPAAWRVYGAAGQGQKLVTLDFVNADIADVLKALAIQSGCNILVAPKVEGKVTIGLRSVTPEQALDYIVRLADLGYGREDETYVICPRDQIKDIFPPGTRGKVVFPPPAEAGPNGTQPAAPPQVAVVRTEKVAAAEAAALAQKLVPGLQTQTPEPKLAVLIGTAQQLEMAQAAIKTLEAAVPAPPAANQGTAEPPKLPEVKIETITLKYVNAGEAVSIVKGLMEKGSLPTVAIVPAPSAAYPSSVKTAATPQAGGSGTVDTTQAVANFLATLAGSKSQPGAAGGGVGAGAPASGGAASALAPAGSPGGTTGSTVAVPQGLMTSTLLLIGPEDGIARVRETLETMDVAPKQVMIDVKVTDLSLTDLQRLGVTWNWSTFGIRELAPAAGGDVVSNLQLGRFGHVPVSFNATLEALVNTEKARVLANPRIAVVDGHTANFHVGDTIRYLKQRTVGINGATVEIGEAQVGVQMDVTPRIGGDSVITMDIRPKVDVITGFTATGDGGQVPNTSERSVETVVRLRDGETLAIGGLIRDEDVVSMQKVPGLGDIPLLGELFRFRTKRRVSSEVLIFITPNLVADGS